MYTHNETRKEMKKTAALLAAIILLIGLAAGLSVTDIKVGIMVPTTGSVATYGKDMENVIKMAVDEINAKGGVLGERFTTVTADDGCDPQMATAAANKIVAAGVDVVVGVTAPPPPYRPSRSMRMPVFRSSSRRRTPPSSSTSTLAMPS
jgi:ABC-type branched-subunit amino acid transport system substrate-binding protein